MTERLQLVLVEAPTVEPQPYDIEFVGTQRLVPLLRHRQGRNRLNESVLVKYAHGGAHATDLLFRAQRIGKIMFDGSGTGYPGQLSRLIGHNWDSTLPMLVTTHIGQELSTIADQFPLNAGMLAPIVRDLLGTLAWLNRFRVVHGRIGLSTLRWDGNLLALTDFEHAVLEGEPQPRCACCPPRDGLATPRDDVLAAGLVIYQLYTGHELSREQARRQLPLDDAVLGRLLTNVFNERPASRPDARELLRRLRLPDPTTTAFPAHWETLEQKARATFADVRQRQREFWAVRPPPATPGVLTVLPPSPGLRLAAIIGVFGVAILLLSLLTFLVIA